MCTTMKHVSIKIFVWSGSISYKFYVAMSMSTVSDRPSDCKSCGVICYLHLLSIPTREVHCCLCTTQGENNVYMVRTVYYCVDQFATCRTKLYDSKQSFSLIGWFLLVWAPTHRPDLSSLDFNLWGHLQDKMFRTAPYTFALNESHLTRCRMAGVFLTL